MNIFSFCLKDLNVQSGQNQALSVKSDVSVKRITWNYSTLSNSDENLTPFPILKSFKRQSNVKSFLQWFH